MNELPNENSRVERFFRARVDRALDDARPLDRVTAWYVDRHPGLREYYETMLRLEIELRFPDEIASFAVSVRKDSPKRFGRTWLFASAATVLLLLLAVTFFSPPKPADPPGVSVSQVDPPQPRDEIQERIDLADLLDLAVPLTERIAAMESPFTTPVFPKGIIPVELPMPSVVRFSEQPLESTLNFLETSQLLRRRTITPETQ